jgi:hypothetical protein
MKSKTLLKNESGAALVIALVMIIVLSLIGLASTLTSTFEIKLSGGKRGTTDAFYAADSGVQVALANIQNFDLPGKYVDHKYDPFTDSANVPLNKTEAEVLIHHDATQQGSPRGIGMSAINFEFTHYVVESTGRDQMGDQVPTRPSCTIEEKVVRLIPTIQGGY